MQAGTLIAEKYRIERVIGRGGMGVVVEATHLHLGTSVALKFLDESIATDPTARARFNREARALALLKSEHSCRVLDFGIDNNAPYMVMELLAGTDLARLSKIRRLDVPTASVFIKQACTGLIEAHAAQIIHRDLKPGNLFLTRRADNSPLIKILDFGVATAPAGAADLGLTGTSNVVGSPGFMSPEQFRSSRTVDGRTDIWSLGVILFKLVMGRLPFNGDGFAEFALSIARDPVPKMTEVHPKFEAIVLQCLEKDIDKRFPDVNALSEALTMFATLARSSSLQFKMPAPNSDGPMLATMVAPAATRAAVEALPKATLVGTTVGTEMMSAATPSYLAGELAPGAIVGEYKIERKIGQGGMGVVYAAIHPLIGKKAAIKVISAELGTDTVVAERFVQEARSVNQIGHPNIVDVFAFGKLPDGRNYFVMEMLQGESLRERLNRTFIPLAEGLQILDEIVSALEAAHEKQIVHRDLKPDNVFLTNVRSSYIVVKLLDFGIAKLVTATGISKTTTGEMIGTPGYLSPEQARGRNVDYRTDIYALGCMMYEVVTGRIPFIAESAMDIVLMHISTPPSPPSTINPSLPPALDQLILETLDKDPERRPSLAEVRNVFAELVATGMVPIEAGSGATFRSELARGKRDSEMRTPRSMPRAPTPTPPSLRASMATAVTPQNPLSMAPTIRGQLSPTELPTSVASRSEPGWISSATGGGVATKKSSRLGVVIVLATLLVPATFIIYGVINKHDTTEHATAPGSGSSAVAGASVDAAVAPVQAGDGAVAAVPGADTGVTAVPVDSVAVVSAPDAPVATVPAARDVTIHLNVPAARVVVDGAIVKVVSGAATVALADGPHTVAVTAAGRVPFETKFDVSTSSTTIEVKLGRAQKSGTTKGSGSNTGDYTIDPFKN